MSNFTDVIYFDENLSEWILVEDQLQNLFEPTKDKEVSIISFYGQPSVVKILLINLIIKTLTENFDGKLLCIDDNAEWFETNDEKYQLGHTNSYEELLFQENESDRLCLRISKPFNFKRTNGDQVLLYIVDFNDSKNNLIINKFWFAIKGICLSLSSSTFYYLPKCLEKSYVLSMETEILFTKSFSNIKNLFSTSKKPFQSIVFLTKPTNNSRVNAKDNIECDNQGVNTGKFLPKEIDHNLIDSNFEDICGILIPDCVTNINKSSFDTTESDGYKLFTSFIKSIFDSQFISARRNGESSLTGSDCFHFVKNYFNFFNQKGEEVLADTSFKDNGFIPYSFIKDNYHSSFIKTTEPKFQTRKELVATHNRLVVKLVNSLLKKEKIKNAANIHQIVLTFFDFLTMMYNQRMKINELSRQKYSEEKVKESCALFLQKLKAYEDNNVIESTDVTELLESIQQIAITNFNSIFFNEPELYQPELKMLIEYISEEKRIFKNDCENKCRVQRDNALAVVEAVSHYENLVDKLQKDNSSLTREEFNYKKSELENSAKEIFLTKCVHGSEDQRKKFKEQFAKNLQNTNTKYKQIIDKNEKTTISHTNSLLVNTIDYYENTMKKHLKTIMDEEILSSVHKVTLNDAVQSFTSQCLNKDMNFFDKYLQELESKIELIYNRLKFKLCQNLKIIEKSYEEAVEKAKDIYVNKMQNNLDENQFFENKEISHIHKEECEKVLNDFKQKPLEKIPSSTQFISNLLTLITEEYGKILEKNTKVKENLHELAENYCKNYSEKYEDEMYEAIKTLNSESDFMEVHKKHKASSIIEFSNHNPFTKNLNLINPFTDKLKHNIKKSSEELFGFLKEQISNQKSEIELVMRQIKIHYREEMSKYFERNCYISKDNLRKFHQKTVDSIIKKFDNKRQNQSKEKFHELIINSLEKSYIPIQEENNKNTPTIPAIGIDLGTTNSAVAFYKPGTPTGREVILHNDGANTTPSVVAFIDDGEMIGAQAKENSYIDPRNTVFSVKRLIGRNYDDESVQNDINYLPFKIITDVHNKPLIEINSGLQTKYYVPEQISAKVLVEMKKVAEKHFKVDIKNAVITVPAYFNDSQKQATKDAATIAGLNVLEIIPEPVAAALGFKLKNTDIDKRNVLVYDLGGGTFDVAVLLIETENIEIKALSGDNHLGGDDFDNNLIEYCLDDFYKQTRKKVDITTLEGSIAYFRLKIECEKKKQLLSARNTATIIVDTFYDNIDLRIEITRDLFERLNSDLFEKTITLLNDTLINAFITHEEIDDVILVGGSTRIPKVREMLSELFPQRQINDTVHPDEAVALGASVRAAILNGIKAQELGHLKILKVAPISLGVKIKDGYMSKIIEKNDRIPIKVVREYETVRDNQKEVEIIVYEGEEQMAIDNKELGRFTLCGLPAGLAGETCIDVDFDIKDDGILFINAVIQNTDNSHEISIIQHKGRLSDQELEQYIQEEKQKRQ